MIKTIKYLTVTICIMLFYGCVSADQRAQFNAEKERTTPKCFSEKDCEIKWFAARRWILNNAGMKLQHVTDDFLETYNPASDSPSLAMRVSKEPLPDGTGYQLKVSAWCNNMFGCNPDAMKSVLRFNKEISAAGLEKRPNF